MTRTTSSHSTTTYELSPVAALRALRSIAYQDWDAYRPMAQTPSWAFTDGPELSDLAVFDDAVLDDSWTDGTWIDEIDLRDDEGDSFDELERFTYQPAPLADVADGERVWYLNEVPAEWIEDSFAPGHGSSPISA